MAKKFAKFLLFVSAIGAAFAGAYYFMKSKEADSPEEDDYDDLDDDSYEIDAQGNPERSYVSLNPEAEGDADVQTKAPAASENASGTTVEEFFDDDDDDDGSMDAI